MNEPRVTLHAGASLREVFHAAGARFVLATLWEINDVHSEALITDFYTRLWKKG